MLPALLKLKKGGGGGGRWHLKCLGERKETNEAHSLELRVVEKVDECSNEGFRREGTRLCGKGGVLDGYKRCNVVHNVGVMAEKKRDTCVESPWLPRTSMWDTLFAIIYASLFIQDDLQDEGGGGFLSKRFINKNLNRGNRLGRAENACVSVQGGLYWRLTWCGC
jgi:hypothetical protein